MVAATNQPIYEGCIEGLSKLSLTTKSLGWWISKHITYLKFGVEDAELLECKFCMKPQYKP